MATLDSLVDDFVGTVDATIWPFSSGASQASGLLTLTAGGYVRAKDEWTYGQLAKGQYDYGTAIIQLGTRSATNQHDITMNYYDYIEGVWIRSVSSSSYQIRIGGTTATTLRQTVNTTDEWIKINFTNATPSVLTIWTAPNGQTWNQVYQQTLLGTYFSPELMSPENWQPRKLIFGLGSFAGSSQFVGVNEPQLTSVTAAKVAGSGATPVPTLKFTKSVTVETAAVGSGLVSPASVVTATSVSAVPMTALGIVRNPDAVLAEFPLRMYPPVTTGAGQVLPAVFNELLNMQVVVETLMAGSATLHPPGEYVLLNIPAISASGMMYPSRRAGPAFSAYAQVVVQTPQNYEGAFAFYRMSDQTNTLEDAVGGYNGFWYGVHALTAGAIVNDSDQATVFDNSTTQAIVGGFPELLNPAKPQPDPRGLLVSPLWNGAGVEIWVKLPVGHMADDVLVARNFDFGGANNPMSVVVGSGRALVGCAHVDGFSTGFALQSTVLINDGNWHQVAVSHGPVLCEVDTPGGQPAGGGPKGANTLRLYVDGVEQARDVAAQVATWKYDMWVGSMSTSGARKSIEATLDDLSWYDYAPSKWEILEHYLQGSGQGGPATREEPTPINGSGRMPVPTIRKSEVIHLLDFHDDFDSGLDTSKWRDQKGVSVVGGSARLEHRPGEWLLTGNYFQCRDSSFIIRVDRLPFSEGMLSILLINEFVLPIWVSDLSLPRGGYFYRGDGSQVHRNIGFRITRQLGLDGTMKAYLEAASEGADPVQGGLKGYSQQIEYVPDDPNHPSPMKWLRLDILPGDHGGAEFYYSADGKNWKMFWAIKGGTVNIKSVTKVIVGKGGELTTSKTKTVVYEDANSFYLFPGGLARVGQLFETVVDTRWRGYMRVYVEAKALETTGGIGGDFNPGSAAPGAYSQVDNVNVEPKGTGTDQQISADHTQAATTTGYDYLSFAWKPLVYTSAKDVTLEPSIIQGSGRLVAPPTPVRVQAAVILASGRSVDPDRGGDAVPIAIPVGSACGALGRLVDPARAGDAVPIAVDVVPIAGSGLVHVEDLEIFTSESRPVPPPGLKIKPIQFDTRPVLVGVTQN